MVRSSLPHAPITPRFPPVPVAPTQLVALERAATPLLPELKSRLIASSYPNLNLHKYTVRSSPPALQRPPPHVLTWVPMYKKHNKVASCGDDSSVRVSDLRSTSPLGVSRRLDGVHGGRPCHTVRWHPFDANLLLTAGLDSTVKLHDLRRPDAPLHVFRGHCPYALARRGQRVVVCCVLSSH